MTLGEVEAEIAYLRQRGELQNRELGGLQAYTSRAAIPLEKTCSPPRGCAAAAH